MLKKALLPEERVRPAARGLLYRAAIIALLLAAYLAIALAPLVLAWQQGLPRRPFIDEFSSAMAIVAFSMLLLEFVLSGRFRIVSAGLGIDLVMRMHQLLARSLLVVLLLHPFLYSLPYAGLGRPDPARVLTVTLTPAATATGLLAWGLLAMLVFFSIFRDRIGWRYETWRLGHGLGAVLIAALGTHHALDTGRYSASPNLGGFWKVHLGVAVAGLAYVYLLKPLLQMLRPYRVSGVRQVAVRTWEIALEPLGRHRLRFLAGQFAWVKFGRALFNLREHPFSFGSGPEERPEIRFLIKESGDFTGRIGEMPAGTPAYLDGPHGNFTLRARAGEGLVFIAGGIGIAPILSLLRHLEAAGDRRPITVIYGNRVREQILPVEELAGLRPRPEVAIHHVLSEPPADWQGLTGVLEARVLERCLPAGGRERLLYFVCGPAPMIDSVEAALAGLGVPLAQIVSEKFQYETGVPTPRDRLVRAAWFGITAALVAAAAGFGLR